MKVELNRPEKRNAIDSEMVEALGEVLTSAELDSEVNVVRISGAGKDFCAGADLKELLESADLPPEQNRASAMALGEIFIKIRELPKPVIAVVHGRSLAGGFGLATACDMILAHEDATFGYPEIRRGFVPAMVMAMLVRAVGEKVAFDLVATGRILSAAQALDLGLVSRVLDRDSFESGTTEILQGLAESSTTALALIKQELYFLEELDFRDAVSKGADVNAIARRTRDFKEAVQAFLDR